ncbi:MAG: aspartate/glutamate racemase family protein, partial [Polyangiales bacterium]
MEKPIGIFDSGLGGLTVARAVREALPDEDLVYLGDTARVPYGTRSARTVVRYALGCAEHLQRFDIKLLVVACNTASGVALGALEEHLSIPVVGVISP